MPPVITTCTRDCPCACGLVAEVENGSVVRLVGNKEHPHTKGLCCAKVPRWLEP